MRTHRITPPRKAALRAVAAGTVTFQPPKDPVYEVGRWVGPNGSNHHSPLNQLAREGYIEVHGTTVTLSQDGRYILGRA